MVTPSTLRSCWQTDYTGTSADQTTSRSLPLIRIHALTYIYRIDQDQPVFVYKLVIEGSVEDLILNRLLLYWHCRKSGNSHQQKRIETQHLTQVLQFDMQLVAGGPITETHDT